VASDGIIYNREILMNSKANSAGFIKYLKMITEQVNPVSITKEDASDMIRNFATLMEMYISKFFIHNSISQNADKITNLLNCIKYISESDLSTSQVAIVQDILVDINLSKYDRVGFFLASLGKQC
jgi:hypothetical protein